MKPTLLSTASEHARMAQLFMHVRDAVIVLDPLGVVTFWSVGAAKIFGRSAPAALNRCYFDLLTVKCRHVQVPLIQAALDGEKNTAEWQTTGAEGAVIWLEGDFRPMHDDMGRRLGCAILLHDITRWRAAEAARRASEELLRNITDSVPGAVFQMRVCDDGQPSFPFISRGVESLLEVCPAEMVRAFGRDQSLIHPDDRQAFWSSLQSAQESKGTWDCEFRVLTTRSNQLKWLRLHAVRSKLPNGTAVWNGVLSDISDRAQATEALRASEARYRLLTENATDTICRITPEGQIVFASASCRRLFGFEPDALAGTAFKDWIYEGDQTHVQEQFGRLLKFGGPETAQHRSKHADGTYVWCESTASAVRNSAGEIIEVVTVTRSVEDRRRLEARVQNFHKMEAIGRLAGGVAHDFNNLLTVINGFSDMILRGIGTQGVDRIAANVREIRQAGERASTLTRQLLAFGRQQPQSRSHLNLNSIISDTQKMLARLIGEDIEFETELAKDLSPVMADVGQIEQVLMNLSVNSRDAMPDGGNLKLRTANVVLERAPEVDVRPGPFVLLEVSDTGVGMDEGVRARVFEPFFTTKEQGKGTGLGLATVYGIVKQSDGHIAIESEVGRGTTVRIYLPRAEVPSSTGTKSSRSQLLYGRETVLLVEDDDGVRKVTAAMLRTLGYKVIEAPGGMEALRHCREHNGPIHLLMTDVVMPMMNGREVANRVQTILPGVKTLFVSGYTDDAILRHGVLDEGVPFLNKPVSHEALSRKLREVLAA